MSPFVYRLEKVLKYRINKKEEQLQIVRLAQLEVQRIQGEIDKNKATIVSLRQSMYQADHILLDNYDKYIKHLYGVIDQLEAEKLKAIEKLNEEKRKLEELEKSINALEKHKEKKHEEYLEEEKQQEMRLLDEIGSQKHFAKMLARDEEELQELMEEEENN